MPFWQITLMETISSGLEGQHHHTFSTVFYLYNYRIHSQPILHIERIYVASTETDEKY